MANGHGGKRPGTGGARPGAGRKKQETKDYQTDMRTIFQEVVTPERWQRVVNVAATFAEAGNKDVRAWLAPWIVGAVPTEIKHTSDPDQPVKVVVEYVHSNTQKDSTT